MSNDIKTMIEQFLEGRLLVSDIESKIRDGSLSLNFENNMEYGELTQPLNKKYYDITCKGIAFESGKAYPPRIECFICLLKAIENKQDVEYYYNEYWKNNISSETTTTEKTDNILY